MKKGQKWLGISATLAVLFSMALSLTSSAFYYSGYVNSFLGLSGQTLVVDGDTGYYPSAYGELNAENAQRLIADEREHCIQAMHEGAVLLRNEDSALPLSENERSVTFFGNSVGQTPGRRALIQNVEGRFTRPLRRQAFESIRWCGRLMTIPGWIVSAQRHLAFLILEKCQSVSIPRS